MIIIIAALTKNRVIGREGKLPWHISEDLKKFKQATTGNTVIMGRISFESVGSPLSNRNNIVISTTMSQTEGVDVCKSFSEAIEKAKSYGKDIFILGGTRVYEEALPLADKMFLSHVKKEYEGDTYFPEFNKDEWIVEKRDAFDEFELVVYKRKQ